MQYKFCIIPLNRKAPSSLYDLLILNFIAVVYLKKLEQIRLVFFL
jgi:hypothetical protein